MSEKLKAVNSYRLTQLDKYITERKEEYKNCKNKCNISSFHYEKLIKDIEEILYSFPDKEFISLYYDNENVKSLFYSLSEKLNSEERLLLYELIENKNDKIEGLKISNRVYYNIINKLEKESYLGMLENQNNNEYAKGLYTAYKYINDKLQELKGGSK